MKTKVQFHFCVGVALTEVREAGRGIAGGAFRALQELCAQPGGGRLSQGLDHWVTGVEVGVLLEGRDDHVLVGIAEQAAGSELLGN